MPTGGAGTSEKAEPLVAGELQVGLIGLAGGAEMVLHALLAEPRVQVVSVGDRDPKLAARHAETIGAEVYTDYRSLIVERRLDALFVAAPHFAIQGYLKLAAAQGTPVWKQTPLARRFDEALALTRVFERTVPGGCPLVVARPWPAEPAMEQAGKRLSELGKPFLVDAHVLVCRPEDLDWRGDSERAGGGVLLHEAYGAIDTVVHWLGPPAEVYAAMSRASRPQTRYPYDTEDTAIVVLKYPDGAVASFACCWTSGPPTSQLAIWATGGTIRIDPAKVAVLSRAGDAVCTPFDRAPNPYTHPIRAFLDGLAGDRKRMGSLARDHLWTMAVIETAYLSSRTGEAESPAKWFEILRADEQPTASPAPPEPRPPPEPGSAEPAEPAA
jgi:predicted dehydrogenase